MLERLYTNVDQTVRSGLVRVLDPIRQTIHHLENPRILQEWDLCEQGVQRIVNDLVRSLVYQQEVQERGLEGGGGDSAGSSSGSTGSTLVKASNNTSNRSISSSFSGNNNNGVRNPRNSTSSTHSAMTAYSTNSNGNNTYKSHQEEGPEESMLILNNNFSQQVFVWRKFTADTFLEECVKSVEDLAQERRELQTRIVELTRVIVEQDEARRLKEISASHEGGTAEATWLFFMYWALSACS